MIMKLNPSLSLFCKRTETALGTLIPLSQLGCQEEGIVAEVPECPRISARLAEMGLAIGTPVTMLCNGRTQLLKAGRTRLSLRSHDIDGVLVERI